MYNKNCSEINKTFLNFKFLEASSMNRLACLKDRFFIVKIL